MGRAADLIFEARRRAGISRPIVNAYERGRRDPGVDALQRLLEAAGCRLVVAGAVRHPDEHAAARDLVELLDLADAIPVRGPRRPLSFPSLVHR